MTITEQAIRDLYTQRWRFVMTGAGIAISVALFTVLVGYTTAMNTTLEAYVGGMASLRTVKGMPGTGSAPSSGIASALTGSPDASKQSSASGAATATVIDSAFIDGVSNWSGVEAAFPEIQLPVTVHAGGRSSSSRASCFDPSQVSERIARPATAGDVLLATSLARRLGLSNAVPDSVTLQFRQIRLDQAALQTLAGGSLPVTDRIETKHVSGVAAGTSSLLTLQSGVLLHPDACAALYWAGAGGGSLMQYRILGSFPGMNVVARSTNDVSSVSSRLESSGLYVWSAQSIQARLQKFTRLIEAGLSILGLVALLISALGLANTILMNVMERRADIGIMRTVGARRRHVAVQFVVQGMLMGFVFGLVGIVGGTGLMVSTEYVLNQTLFSGLDFNLFQLSILQATQLLVGASAFCALVAVLPARHAAHVDPARAVRSAR